MNPNSMPPNGPQGPMKAFKESALKRKYSFSFTLGQLIMIANVLRPIQLPLGDLRNKVLVEVMDTIERTALNSITDADYEEPEKPKMPAGADKPQPTPAAEDKGVAVN